MLTQLGRNLTFWNSTEDLTTKFQQESNDTMDGKSNFSSNFEEFGEPFLIPEIPALSTTEQIELYGNLIVVPVGVVLNLLSFVIFYKIKTHKTATGLHLMCIALGDSLVIIGLFAYSSRHWTCYISLPSIMNSNQILCNLMSFITGIGIFMEQPTTCLSNY